MAVTLNGKYKAVREIADNKKTVIQVALTIKYQYLRLIEYIESFIDHS